jgi:diguanylate cyclase (GGDEF)-like protein/PAS domain S-box-containing protein
VTYLNPVAERMTGWSRHEATGRPLDEVFRLADGQTRRPARDPMTQAMRLDRTVGLTPNCLLVRRDGLETAIEDSASPIHDRRGQIIGAVIVFKDVAEARAASQQTIHLAQHDPLTDLPNRLLLRDRVTQAIAMARRQGRRLAVMFLDLDRFKQVNDDFGHPTGDLLLRSVARRLVTCVRSSDTVSRLGGDEFVVLLSQIGHADDAAGSARKIMATLGAPHDVAGHRLHIGVTIGIGIYPDDGSDAETLISRADIAMYHAKSRGRNDCQFFERGMSHRRQTPAVSPATMEYRVHTGALLADESSGRDTCPDELGRRATAPHRTSRTSRRGGEMKPSTKNEIAGTIHEVKGTIKEKAGHLVGNPSLEAKGLAEQGVGQIQKKIGQLEKVIEKP